MTVKLTLAEAEQEALQEAIDAVKTGRSNCLTEETRKQLANLRCKVNHDRYGKNL
jgi:hypothetical protein